MFLKFFRFLKGYAVFEAHGARPERFINLCRINSHEIIGIVPVPGGIRGCIKASEYRHLKKYVRRCGVKLRCTEKHGLPFLLNRYRLRTGMFLGPVLFLCILFFLSNFIWSIGVIGADDDVCSRVVSALEKSGIRKGTPLSRLDADNLRIRLLTELPELSWMSLNLSGTHLSAEIKMRIEKPEIPDGSPCNIVALCDGHITELRVFRGAEAVKCGDSVLRGDLLVSGTVEYPDGMSVLKQAAAEVIAETTEVYYTEIPLVQNIEYYTGNVIEKSVAEFFHIRVPLYLGNVQGDYEKSVVGRSLCIDTVKLPIGIHTGVFREKAHREVILTEDEALSDARFSAEKAYSAELANAEILSVSDSYELKNGLIHLKTEVFCKKNIAGRENILLFNE